MSPGRDGKLRIAINGIGVAGPTLAFWLARAGHDVLLVDQSPRLRTGGYVIDFWGIGYDIADRMGVISATILQAIERPVETTVGDSIAAIEDDGPAVRVRFDHAPEREFDLVIGAGGLHSRVRQLVFGPESNFEVALGYHVAAFEATGYQPREELVYTMYSQPGRQISRFTTRDSTTIFLFIVRDELISGNEEPKALLRRAFADAAWEWPQIQAAPERVHDIYFDSVSQIRMPRWTKGRVALVGDAAACVSLMAGEGTGLAIAEAYVLAGELQAARGDVPAAFAAYEQRLMPFLETKQKAAARFTSSFAPKTSFGIAVRDIVTRLMGLPFVADLAMGRALRDDITLPDYDQSSR